jgi:hypothetical protein
LCVELLDEEGRGRLSRARIARRAGVSPARAQPPLRRVIEREAERGGLRPDCDPELLLDLLDGALYYRLLWRGERLARAEVEPLVDTVLAGFLR